MNWTNHWLVRTLIVILIVILVAIVIAALGGFSLSFVAGHFHWNFGVAK